MEKRYVKASAAVFFSLTAFLYGCNEEPAETQYIPYNYDLSSYISVGQVVGVKYTPADETVSEDEIRYRVTRDLREAGFYEEELAFLVSENIESGEILFGDTVIIDCSATVDGAPYVDASADDMPLELGAGGVSVYGFETGLVGTQVGEEVDLLLRLPSDYSVYSMRGKEIKFTVTVKCIEKRYGCPEELSPEQLACLGEYGDFDSYLDAVKSEITEEKKKAAAEKKIADCWMEVMNGVSLISYPQIEMEMYVADYISYTEDLAKNTGFTDLDEYLAASGMTRSDLESAGMEYARGDVLQEMTVYSIARAEGFDKMSDELFEEFASVYAEELGCDTVEQLVYAVGFYDVQKRVLTDVVKLYIAENALPTETTDDPPETGTPDSEEA